MPTLEWLYYAAAAWYLAYAITNTHGPFGLFEKVREFKGGHWHGRSNPLKEVAYEKDTHTEGLPPNSRLVREVLSRDGLLDCIICLMPWLALLLHVLGTNIITDALAIAGVALWLHGFTGWRHTF